MRKEVIINKGWFFTKNSDKGNLSCTAQAQKVEEAKQIESMIEDAGLVVLPNSTHYAYLENLNYVVNILRNFL